jgi:hypothetical protein
VGTLVDGGASPRAAGLTGQIRLANGNAALLRFWAWAA